MAYLVDHPPARSQYRSPRRSRPTGLIVVHSAENVPDVNPPDTGAENVARFIEGRSSPGSYHDLCDSDSTINLVRYSDEAYQDGTGSNPWALSVSGAFQAHQWRTIPLWWRNACIDQMARAARRQADWLRVTYGIHVPARRITRSQSEAGEAGFISHAERDPGRRSDPGPWFPWDQLLRRFSELDRHTTPTTIAPIEEDDMITGLLQAVYHHHRGTEDEFYNVLAEDPKGFAYHAPRAAKWKRPERYIARNVDAVLAKKSGRERLL